LLSPLFPITLVISGVEILVEKENFEINYIFDLIEKLTERIQLTEICFYKLGNELTALYRTERNLALLLMYALMKGKKLELYLCQ